MDFNKFELSFFIVLFAGILLLVFMVLQPHLIALAIAAVLAVLSYPLYERIGKKVKNETVSALATVLIIGVIVLIPIVFLGGLLFNEAREISTTISQNGIEGVFTVIQPIQDAIDEYFPQSNFEVNTIFNGVVTWITNNLGAAFAGTAQVILGVAVCIIAFFYFLKDGRRFIKTFIEFSPLENKHDRAILKKLEHTIFSVIQGSLSVAVIQGLLTGLGFWLFGVPNAVLWGSVAAVAALIPGIGTGLVIAPGILYLVVTGNQFGAIGLTVWGSIAVGMIDNVLLPKFLGARARIHPLFVLVSVLGGLSFFGPSGFLLGPLVLSLLYGLGDIYIVMFKQQIEEAAKCDDDEET